jgi:hypothetical protein
MSETFSDEDRAQFARALMQLVDRWGLDSAQRTALLGLPQETKARALSRLRQGEPLPPEPEILHRARCLLEIEHSLETMLPLNAAIVDAWIVTENMLLASRRPLDVMIEDGVEGLERVMNSLTGGGDW